MHSMVFSVGQYNGGNNECHGYYPDKQSEGALTAIATPRFPHWNSVFQVSNEWHA
jgi:hypothetical protein